jgi:hypothetical protein
MHGSMGDAEMVEMPHCPPGQCCWKCASMLPLPCSLYGYDAESVQETVKLGFFSLLEYASSALIFYFLTLLPVKDTS